MGKRSSPSFIGGILTSANFNRSNLLDSPVLLIGVGSERGHIHITSHTMLHIREIDHLVLRVVNLDSMIRFYCEVFGCTIERRQDKIGLIQLRAGRSLLDLVPVDGELGRAGGAAPGKEGRNLDHFCFRVEPFDEDSIRRHLHVNGVEAGSIATRYGAEGYGDSIYVTDPEGNIVEIKGPPHN
jgi:glyoxylase I family protein